ncbi:MAG: UPF0182 family protein [Synergistota bacterium]|nr:UPF0182 family protein [Synergistota bacterium]
MIRLPKVNKWLLILAAAVLLVSLLLPALAEFYTDWLWYDSEGYGSVFWTRLLARVPLFLAGLLAFTAAIWVNLVFVRRNLREIRPEFTPLLSSRAAGIAVGAIALFIGVTEGASLSAEWAMVLRFFNGTPFGVTDPVFGNDVGFYIFSLPFWSFVHSRLMGALFLCAMMALVGYGATLAPRSRDLADIHVPKNVRSHLIVLASIGALLWGLGYALDRYAILFSPTGVVFGAGYTDVHAGLLALNVLTVGSILVSIALLFTLFKGSWKLPLWLLGFLVVSSFVLRGVYPMIVQKYIVEPNEFDREKRFIENNIEATLRAYNLHKAELQTIVPAEAITWRDVEENRDTIDNIRLWDHEPLLRSYKQLQEIRTYYDFSNVDIDRYTIPTPDGGTQYRQVMLAARELDLAGMQNRTWINTRLEFTHGYGIVMNPVNEAAGSGLPRLWVRDLPPVSDIPLPIDRPQIYFGEKQSPYIFVGTTVQEFDYPMGDSNARTAYNGAGGVPMGTFMRRLLFSLKFADIKILFSDVFTPESRVLFHQNIRERLTMIAPYLQFEGDPYLVVSGGRLVWMMDGYTVANSYPYSQPVVLGRGRAVNYIRNSVKATVDAYDGTMTFYAADPEDPVLRAWSGIFPGVFRPFSEMKQGLKEHLRYPQDLFNIQSEIYRTYHMTDANTFYNKEDVWDRMGAGESRSSAPEAYYVNMRLAGSDIAEFALISPFMPVSRNNMIAWMAGRSDGENYGKLLVYQFPKQTLIYGPAQVEALTNQNSEISAQLALWSSRGTAVIRGNMTVVPVGEGLLYVQPLYLRAENSELPELRRVITSTGGRVVWGETLEDSLKRLLSHPETGLGRADDPEMPTRPDVPRTEPRSDDGTLSGLAAEAMKRWDDSQEALRRGDWEGYGREMSELELILREMTDR